MNVGRVSFATLALSGALAGLAGGVQLSGVPAYVLFPDIGLDGIGFTGIAVALLGRLSAVGVVFSAIFFGMLSTAFRALEKGYGRPAIAMSSAQGTRRPTIAAAPRISRPAAGNSATRWRRACARSHGTASPLPWCRACA